MMNQRERDALDNYITGHYGEDQFRGMAEPSRNTVETRRISHELVEAWNEVKMTHGPIWYEAEERMEAAMDAIIAGFTPGYNAESDPEWPEEYDEDDQPTQDALREVGVPDGPFGDPSISGPNGQPEYARPECGCGHPAHDGPCTGTLASMSDGDTVAFMVRDGADPNEPCACTVYLPMPD